MVLEPDTDDKDKGRTQQDGFESQDLKSRDLDSLSERIQSAKVAAGLEEEEPSETKSKPSGRLTRIGSDFLATILACVGIGWLFDHELGTHPWGLLIMLFFGFAVAFSNVWRVLNGMKPSLQWRSDK